jgi:lipopolysaccharide heptosyltransferase II
MGEALQVYDARERRLVGAADLLLRPLEWLSRRAASGPIRRVLLLRLERIGDLVMTLEAIRDARAAWPDAKIDLAMGAWNAALRPFLPELDRVDTLSVPWLARGEAGLPWARLLRSTRDWRERQYDLVVNFEPDIRSNLLAWLSGAPRRVGYASGGGGAFLTTLGTFDQATHVSTNARRLIALAAGRDAPATTSVWPRLEVPPDARTRMAAVLGQAARPLVGIHASGGRESKQWHLDRFAGVGRALAATRGATIILTGSGSDEPLVSRVQADMGKAPVVRVTDLELPELAALLGELDVFITGDTGPMHLAAAMGTPVVALFGPSNPVRYGPRARRERILRVDLPCSPCGQVRLPPERCRGHVPDCLNEIGIERVVAAALDLLDQTVAGHQPNDD